MVFPHKCYFLFLFIGLFCLINPVKATVLQGTVLGNELQKGMPKIEIGVSRKLAMYRKAVVSKVHYVLEFDIPEEKNIAIKAKETMTFQLLENKYPLQLDFKEEARKIKSMYVNGKPIAIQHTLEHVIIDVSYLIKGHNEVRFEFLAGEGALNRNADYLYTLFVPDRARTVFPCFDQPDLKAQYTLTLKIPAAWKAIANANLRDTVLENQRKTLHFKTSDGLSTYLFAFAAGNFQQADGKTADWNTAFLYRETDSTKINYSIKQVFDLHTDALNFMQDWTAIPYPFQKFGYVALPDFQFGGMEHPGAIQYKASSLFLDPSSTKDQVNARNNLIAHETAHMWFGDLVTMNWFTDVWMKEVFANFMADKSMEARAGQEEFNLKFLVDHFPPAYAVDRSIGANPIRQDLDNLKDAGSLYGNIIYHKAPIMMRQLESLMGKTAFQQGVREYLKKFSGSNASWPDLINILGQHSPVDLQKWNTVWVNGTGRPQIDYAVNYKNQKISGFSLRQQTEYGKPKTWPQEFELTFFYPDHRQQITVQMSKAKMEVPKAIGMEKPLYILFNSAGAGYGVFPVDTAIFSHLYRMESPLNRASAYISLYENMLNGKTIKPQQLLKLFTKGLSAETNELNLKLINGYLSTLFWNFTRPEIRIRLAADLEGALWKAMDEQSAANNKKILFKTFQDICLSERAAARLYAIWNTQIVPQGLKLAEDDYTALAFSLALKGNADTSILTKQLSRIKNADRRQRFTFISPAVSAREEVRDQFFKGLELKANRTKESNVLSALYYLHHPLRQLHAVKYLNKSLNMLTEIQTTGDIFFPQSWLQATLGSYQSAEAAKIVRDFLQQHPDYNPKLKAKIIQAADNLFRAEKLLK